MDDHSNMNILISRYSSEPAHGTVLEVELSEPLSLIGEQELEGVNDHVGYIILLDSVLDGAKHLIEISGAMER